MSISYRYPDIFSISCTVFLKIFVHGKDREKMDEQRTFARGRTSTVCRKCGATVLPSDEYCPSCGESNPAGVACPSCGTLVRPGDNCCPKCGQRMPGAKCYCPKCGRAYVGDVAFCTNCGTPTVVGERPLQLTAPPLPASVSIRTNRGSQRCCCASSSAFLVSTVFMLGKQAPQYYGCLVVDCWA